MVVYLKITNAQFTWEEEYKNNEKLFTVTNLPLFTSLFTSKKKYYFPFFCLLKGKQI